jgi:hypothetical protein
MTSDRDVYAAANLFILQHGDTAAIEAAMRADEHGARGDLDGRRVWMRVMEAIEQLQREPAPGEPVN